MVTGAVYVDLTQEPDAARETHARDRQRLAVLEHCPDGARVVVDIGRRQYVTDDAARWLHQHEPRLLIEIIGQRPEGVLRFVQAARADDWSIVA